MHCKDPSQSMSVEPEEPGNLTFDLFLSPYPELKGPKRDKTGLCQSDPYDHY